MAEFELHPQLAADSLPVTDLGLSSVRLINDRNFPWLLLVPRQPGMVDLTDLAPPDRITLMEEIGLACDVLKALAPCDKLNVASLGNQVPQLHVHVIARLKSDAAWPNPVWGAAAAVAYPPDEAQRLVGQLASKLAGKPATRPQPPAER
jgi:diadenosine tetraphosphate (Ap4A) HIT family hydrolase